MDAAARVWWRLLRAGMRESSVYRLALVGGLLANVTFGFLKAAILGATVRASGGSVAGYDLTHMSAYVWFSQGMLGSINVFGRTELADRIRSGDVVVDFVRPLDVQVAACLRDVGRGLFALLPRGVPSAAVGALAVGVAVPSTGTDWLLGGVSVLLAIAVSATSVYLVAVAGFWLVDTRGVQVLYMVVSGFFAGLFVPLPLLPGWLQVVVHATPFPSLLQYPVDVLSGRVSGMAAAGLVAVQLCWLLVTAVAGQALTRAGRRVLEVQGG